MVILGSGVFWSFCRFRDYFGNFSVSGVFWSFSGFRGILVIFLVLEGILVNLRFWGYFGQFLGFWSILVILGCEGLLVILGFGNY